MCFLLSLEKALKEIFPEVVLKLKDFSKIISNIIHTYLYVVLFYLISYFGKKSIQFTVGGSSTLHELTWWYWFYSSNYFLNELIFYRTMMKYYKRGVTAKYLLVCTKLNLKNDLFIKNSKAPHLISIKFTQQIKSN